MAKLKAELSYQKHQSGSPSLRDRLFADVDRVSRAGSALAPAVAEGWEVVVVEPSDAVMFQSDYLALLTGEDVERVAANTYGVCEFLDRHRLDEHVAFDPPEETLTYHGHCHQTAINREHHAVAVLRRAGYEVDALDSGCCGMAGSFGYEAEHYSMSKAIGSILFDQIGQSDGETVVAPGASCRTQLSDAPEEQIGSPSGANTTPPHPVEMLDSALQ
jgi:Fe-S oxidoreductase